MNIEKIKIYTDEHPILKEILQPIIFIRRFLTQRKYLAYLKIYENLCNLLTEDITINVPEFQGFFSVDCHSDLFKRILINKEYESSLVNMALKYVNKDRDVIDVGANIGFYTVLFAKNLKGKKVLSIEPTDNALRRLYKNVEQNEVTNRVIVFEGAASDHSGKTEIKMKEGKEEYSTLGLWKHPSIRNETFVTQQIDIATVDDLASKHNLDPGFIKIDVEGCEHLVLKGLKNTLENKRPVILSELSNYLLKQNGSSSLEVITFLNSFHYTVIDAENAQVNPASREFTNILAIPQELQKSDLSHYAI
ncbi:MAG: FkbM family methyltransferase [Victivallales bacterium]|nr:FkbM family methyltransferase [Victivallales bacterium]